MLDLPHTPENELHFLARLGEMLLAWNSVESWMAGLLTWQIGGGSKMNALTAHIGNVTLTDILRTFAADFSNDIVRPHLVHAAEYFDRLREYRNYYAHGSQMLWPQRGEALAYLHQATAKGRFALHQTFIAKRHLEFVIAHCETLHDYCSALVTIDDDGIVHPPPRMDRFPEPAAVPPSLLEKPPLPDRLKKPRQFPQEPSHPPQSSEG
jgi:hypothetical protein